MQSPNSSSFAAQVMSLPPEIRAALAERYKGKAITVLALPYYSTVRFAFTTAGVLDTTAKKAFSYGIGSSPTGAGFASGYGNATQAETNLTVGNQTLNGADVLVYGLAAHITADSEPAYARRVWRDTFLELAIGSSTTLPLGTLEMLPGAGGLRGIGQSAIKVPPLNTAGMATEGGPGASIGFIENGQSAAGNYFRLPQPIAWSGVANGVDSTFNIVCRPARAVTELVAPVRAAGAGILAFTPPAAAGDPGTYVDVRFHLVCVSINVRSGNV